MKRIISTLIFAVLIFVPIFYTYAAVKPLQFGGFATVAIPCTCSTGIWLGFTPLFLGGPVISPGALTYRPIPTGPSIPYELFTAGLPGRWYLGDYFPTPGTCWIYAGTACIPLPDLGVIFQVGTGRSPAGI